MAKFSMQAKLKLIDGSKIIKEQDKDFLLVPKTSKLDMIGVKYWKAPSHYKIPINPYALFIIERLDGHHTLEDIENKFNLHFEHLPNKSRDRFLRLINKLKKWLILD